MKSFATSSGLDDCIPSMGCKFHPGSNSCITWPMVLLTTPMMSSSSEVELLALGVQWMLPLGNAISVFHCQQALALAGSIEYAITA